MCCGLIMLALSNSKLDQQKSKVQMARLSLAQIYIWEETDIE